MRDGGRLLAIQRADNGAWELPSGVLELEETREEGVRREVLEEAGIHVEVGELTGVYKNVVVGVVALVFRCKPSSGAERTSDETTAVQWLTPEEASERMSSVYAVRLLDALDGDGPHVRSHDGRQLLTVRVRVSLLHQAPGCAPLRRAGFPAPLRATLLPAARSARAAPTPAPVDG